MASAYDDAALLDEEDYDEEEAHGIGASAAAESVSGAGQEGAGLFFCARARPRRHCCPRFGALLTLQSSLVVAPQTKPN